MEYKLIIDGRLPCLNDYLKAERSTYRSGGGFTTQGNTMKKEAQELIIWRIRQQLKGLHIDKPVRINYLFVEPNKKRDLDGIVSFAMKVIQDSLVLAGTLNNDGWKWIKGFNHDFDVCKENPHIEVTIVEISEGE